MSTLTPNFSLIKPGVNDPTDEDLWGGYLNDDLDDIDTLLTAIVNTRLNAMAANTVKVNATTGSATPTDLAIAINSIVGRGPTGNLASLLVGTGLTITDTGITAIASGITQVKTQFFDGAQSTTYTPNTGMVYGICLSQAPGGGGGSTNTGTTDIGLGGSAGEFVLSLFTAADIGASKPLVVGNVGSGGSIGSAGSNATDNTLGTTLIVAKGGRGGAASTGFGSLTPTANGGTGTGTLKIPGATSDLGEYASTTEYSGSLGGKAIWGSPGVPARKSAAGDNASSGVSGYGCGGPGGYWGGPGEQRAGKNGGAGFQLIIEFVVI